jgi:AcrR family transcriptional regulator
MDSSPNFNQVSRHVRRRLQTRAKLIQAALQLVLEKGYDSITVQDITERADLGRGTFYIHFNDKEDILWAAIRDSIKEIEQEAHKQFEQGLPDQYEYYGLLNIFNHAQQNQNLYRVLFGGQGSALLTARVQELWVKISSYDIRSAPAAPEVNFNIPEEIEAQLLTGVITRLLYWWLEKPNSYSAEQMAAITYTALYRKAPPNQDTGAKASE